MVSKRAPRSPSPARSRPRLAARAKTSSSPRPGRPLVTAADPLRPLGRSAALLLAVLASPGCSPQLTGPAPIVSGVTPKVICNTAPTTINVAGDGFSALPIGSLGSHPTLALPRIEIARTTALDGTKTTDAAIRIDGSLPGGAVDGAVGDGGAATAGGGGLHYRSQQSIDVDLTADLQLVSGVYDVTVTNPDGQKTTFSPAFAIVPGPKVSGVMPTATCVAMGDQTVTLTGDNIALEGSNKPTVIVTGADMVPHPYVPTRTNCKPVAGAGTLDPNLQLCTDLDIVLKKGDLPTGPYTITLQNPPQVSCSTTGAGKPLLISPPPKITSVTPTTVCTGGSSVTIVGSGFQMTARVLIDGMDATIRKGGPSSLTVSTVGPYVAGMTYDVAVTNVADGCGDTLPMALTAVAPATLAFVDTGVVYGDLATPIAVYTKSFMAPVSKLLLVKGMTNVDLGGTVDANDATRVNGVVPAKTAPGTYDLVFTDATGCPATIAGAVKVVGKGTLKLTGVSPAVGYSGAATTVQIASDAMTPFSGTPRVFLVGKNGKVTALASVSAMLAMNNLASLQAVVPPGTDAAAGANPYDVVVLTPDGNAAVLPGAYTSLANPLPVITSVTPATVPPMMTMTQIDVKGANFDPATAAIAIVCDDMPPTKINVANANLFLAKGDGKELQTQTLPFPALAPGVHCGVTVTNGDGGSATWQAIGVTGMMGAPSPAVRSPYALNIKRRGLSLLTGAPADSARYGSFVYAIGGDQTGGAGPVMGATDTIEFAPTDGRGVTAAFQKQRLTLKQPTTLAGAARVGRFLYVIGGNDSVKATATVERAVLLDPARAPVVKSADFSSNAAGPDAGVYVYRVSAVLDAMDGDNPNGETLASPPFAVHVPSASVDKVQVKLTWTALPGAASYRVYRTPVNGAAGTELILADKVMGTTLTDDGTGTPKGDAPLPLGSTGAFTAVASLNVPRESAAVLVAQDPVTKGVTYLYAVGGRDDKGAALASYEYLAITVDAVTGAQALGTWQTDMPNGLASARFAAEAAAYLDAQAMVSTTYLYVVGGTSDGMTPVPTVEAATVTAGGKLSAFAVVPGAVFPLFGAASVAIAGQLLFFGDPVPDAIITGVTLAGSPPAFGMGAPVGMMTGARYLPGAAVLGPTVFVAGGSDATKPNPAVLSTVEWMVY